MGDLTEHFSRSEFACQGEGCCGGSAPISPELVDRLQKLRDRVDGPLMILSGFRCNRHNARVPNASPNSQHRFGLAADVKPADVSVQELADMARDLFPVVLMYPKFIHVDIRRPKK